jgi:serine/threonine protein kinase
MHWQRIKHGRFSIIEFCLPGHSIHVPTRFVVESRLIKGCDMSVFLSEITRKASVLEILPGFGRCLWITQDHSEWMISPGFLPDFVDDLPFVADYPKLSDSEVIALTDLTSNKSAPHRYMTHATALVTYKGDVYVAKSAENHSFCSTFMEEVDTLQLLRHDSIIRPPRMLIEHEDHIIGFLLKYYPKGNVREHAIALRTENKLRPELLLKWFCQAAKGLRHVLYNGVEYQNIKPENCVVDEDDNLILIDFASNAAVKRQGRAPEVYYQNPGAFYNGSEYEEPHLDSHDVKRKLTPHEFTPGKSIPDFWPKKAREKAMVFTLARTFWMICESQASNPMPEMASTEYPFSTIFTDLSADLLPEWKEFVLTCVRYTPKQRPSLKEIAAFCDKELAKYATRGSINKRKREVDEGSSFTGLEREMKPICCILTRRFRLAHGLTGPID